MMAASIVHYDPDGRTSAECGARRGAEATFSVTSAWEQVTCGKCRQAHLLQFRRETEARWTREREAREQAEREAQPAYWLKQITLELRTLNANLAQKEGTPSGSSGAAWADLQSDTEAIDGDQVL